MHERKLQLQRQNQLPEFARPIPEENGDEETEETDDEYDQWLNHRWTDTVHSGGSQWFDSDGDVCWESDFDSSVESEAWTTTDSELERVAPSDEPFHPLYRLIDRDVQAGAKPESPSPVTTPIAPVQGQAIRAYVPTTARPGPMPQASIVLEAVTCEVVDGPYDISEFEN